MYWQDTPQDSKAIRDDVLDVAFAITCRTLPVDHAWVLSRAVLAVLPWLADEPGAGVHTIHVAESGNGWMRPEGGDALLYLSRRTRLTLRVPRRRLEDARRLSGRTLDLGGHPLVVGAGTERALATNPAVFARYVVTDESVDENAFLAQALAALRAIGVRPRKMLCGIEHVIQTPDAPLRTRSLMVADLAPEESVALQAEGLGPQRTLGCGLFLPHKDIQEVGATGPVLE
jgi:CRISPR-associated protein Cas6